MEDVSKGLCIDAIRFPQPIPRRPLSLAPAEQLERHLREVFSSPNRPTNIPSEEQDITVDDQCHYSEE